MNEIDVFETTFNSDLPNTNCHGVDHTMAFRSVGSQETNEFDASRITFNSCIPYTNSPGVDYVMASRRLGSQENMHEFDVFGSMLDSCLSDTNPPGVDHTMALMSALESNSITTSGHNNNQCLDHKVSEVPLLVPA
jgi:hypothetical protein